MGKPFFRGDGRGPKGRGSTIYKYCYCVPFGGNGCFGWARLICAGSIALFLTSSVLRRTTAPEKSCTVRCKKSSRLAVHANRSKISGKVTYSLHEKKIELPQRHTFTGHFRPDRPRSSRKSCGLFVPRRSSILASVDVCIWGSSIFETVQIDPFYEKHVFYR